MEQNNYLIEVTRAKYLGDYKIWLKFSDGEERIVDMEKHLHGPIFEPLKDKGLFEQFRVDEELGTIVWPNGADYAPYGLYDLGKPAAKKIKKLSRSKSGTNTK